jgi:TolB protein
MTHLAPVLATALALSAAPAVAQGGTGPIIGDIEGAEFRPFPVAISRFRTPPGAKGETTRDALQLAKVVRDDLELSSVFKVLSPKSFIDTDGVTLNTIKWDDWLNVGADGLVKAIVRGDADNLSVEVHGYEVAAQREGLTKTFTGKSTQLRALAHEIADAVYRYYTAEPSVFLTRIAAVKKIGGEKHVVVMDMDGEQVVQATRGGGLNLLPSFSPSGNTVLFTSYRYDNPDLFEAPAGGGKPTRISNRAGLNTGGRVSADGSKIALTLSQDGNSEVYLLDRRGGLIKRLTKAWGIDTSPSWSPDGKRIAFVSSRAGNPHIYIMNSDGSGQKRLTFQGTYNQTPNFSPRGDLIAFTARDEFNRFDIFTLELATGNIVRLTQDQGNNEDPWFAPNGRLVVFTSTRKGGRQLWITNLDGTHQRRITAGGDHSSPAWGPFPKKR